MTNQNVQTNRHGPQNKGCNQASADSKHYLVSKLRPPGLNEGSIGRSVCPDGKSGMKGLERVREKSRECHNHKPQPIPDTKRKQTKPNKRKSNKRTKSTKVSFFSSPSEIIAILKGLKNTRTITPGKT